MGPYTIPQMKEFFEAGTISPETHVWCKGMAEWLPLEQTPLRGSVMPVPPPPVQLAVPPPPSPKPPADTCAEKRQSSRQPRVGSTQLGDRNRVTSIAELRRASRRLSRRIPSQCFMEEFEPGALIWVEDSAVVWKLCQVISHSSGGMEVELVEERKTAIVDTHFQETHRHNPHVVPDMTSLHYLHEVRLPQRHLNRAHTSSAQASILYNLGVRAAERLPYTYMGSVLIAVNPLQAIPMPDMALYTDHTSRQDMPPHPFAIAGNRPLALRHGYAYYNTCFPQRLAYSSSTPVRV